MTLNVMVVSATTIIPDSGTVTRLMTTLSALRQDNELGVHATALESPRLLADRALVRQRRSAMSEVGVPISFLPLLPQRLPGGRSTMVSAAALSITPLLQSRRPDIVFAINADAAAACARALRHDGSPCRHIFEMHGLESEEAIFAGTVERGSVDHSRRQKIEQAALDWADEVVAPTVEACDWGRSKSSSPAHWHDLPTLSSLRLTNEEIKAFRGTSRHDLGWDGNKVLLYIGGMNEWQQPELMVSVFFALHAADAGWRFLVLTQDVEHATKTLTSAGIDASSFHVASVNHDQVAKHATAGDVALLLRKPHLMNAVASPTKFGEYLEMGVPVCLTEALPSMAKLTVEAGIGLVVDAEGSATAIAEDIKNFVSETDRATLATKARAAAAEHYDQSRADTVYRTIINNARRRLDDLDA